MLILSKIKDGIDFKNNLNTSQLLPLRDEAYFSTRLGPVAFFDP